MSDWLSLVVASFAVYRIARMITLEEGVFSIFEIIRTKAFERFGNGWINNGINCFHCVAFWIALVVAIILIPLFGYWSILVWFGLAGAASFIHEVTQ